MNRPLKKLKLLPLLSFLLLLLYSCNKEEDFTAIDNQNIKVSHKKFDDIIKEEKFSNTLSTISNKIKGNSKTAHTNTTTSITVMENQYNFTILKQVVNSSETDTMVSYTMKIVRENSLPNELENLVVHVNNQNVIKSWIIKYVSDVEITSLNINEVVLNSKKIITPITYNDTPMSFIAASPCKTVKGWVCNYPGHTPDGVCTKGHWEYTTTCDYGGSGGGTGTGGTGGTSGGGTGNGTTGDNTTIDPHTSTSNSNPIVTVPVTPVVITEPEPCKIMAKKSGSVVFKNKTAYLKQPNVISQNHENGFAETIDTNGNITYMTISASPITHALQFPATLKMTGFVHDHQNDYVVNGNTKVTIKNFSPLDLFTFVTHVQTDAASLGIPSSETYGVVITSEGSFAIKLLGSVIDNLTNDQWMQFNRDYEKKAQEMQTEGNLNSNNLQKMLLTFMKEYGLYQSIGLFEANDDLTSWSRKTLDKDGDLAPAIPCKN